MRLRHRVLKAEKAVVPSEDDGPITIVELFSGTRDREYRRRIGPERVREDAKRIRELVASLANDNASDDVMEGDDRSDIDGSDRTVANRSITSDNGILKNLGESSK